MKKLLSFLIIGFLCVGCSQTTKVEQPTNTADEETVKKFDTFLEQEFVETMENDFLTLHYTIRNDETIEKYGIEIPEVSLGTLQVSDYEENHKINQEFYDELMTFERDKLNQEQQITYDFFKTYLELSFEMDTNWQMDFLFTPMSSLTDNLLTNFVEYRFDDEKDVQNYLTLLADVDRYLDDALAFTQAQFDEGYSLSDYGLQSTIDSIEEFVAKDMDEQPLVIIFNNKINELGLSNADEYIQKNSDIITNEFIPAYQETAEQLATYIGKIPEANQGISGFENGMKYYQSLVQNKIGSTDSFDEIFNETKEHLENSLVEYVLIVQNNPELEAELMNSSSYFTINDATQILKLLQDNYEKDFPDMGEIPFTVDYLDKTLISESTLAYYLNPPMDDYSHNVMKVNPNLKDDATSLSTTLAHEGFPGHMLQFNYYHAQSPSPLREIITPLGYVEGWAQYASTTALPYFGMSKDLARIYAINDMFGYYLQTLVDFGVNGYGWSVEELENFLSDYGYESIAQALYDEVAASPAVITSYGYGLVKFENYEKKAKDEIKNFDRVSFTTMLLKNGPLTFNILDQIVDDYIQNNK